MGKRGKREAVVLESMRQGVHPISGNVGRRVRVYTLLAAIPGRFEELCRSISKSLGVTKVDILDSGYTVMAMVEADDHDEVVRRVLDLISITEASLAEIRCISILDGEVQRLGSPGLGSSVTKSPAYG